MKKNITITLRARRFSESGAYKIEKLTNTLSVAVSAKGKPERKVYIGALLTNEEADSLTATTKGYDVTVLDVKS
jgi:hypothetical protein